MSPRRRSRPRSLEEMIPRVLDDLGLDRARALMALAEVWERVVGPEAAAHCRPAALRGDVLEVEVDAPAWGHALQLRTPALLAALERELGEAAPADLWMRVG